MMVPEMTKLVQSFGSVLTIATKPHQD